MSAICLICQCDANSDNVVLRNKGLASLLNACVIRKDDFLHHVLSTQEAFGRPVVVHNHCRKRYTDLRKVETEEKENIPTPAKKTRSSLNAFSWKEDCLFCAQKCDWSQSQSQSQSHSEEQSAGSQLNGCNGDYGSTSRFDG